jgi:ABC-type dipeptide/oligopeptide/nickel transport system permease subunit
LATGEFREDKPAPLGAGAELTEIDPVAVLPRTPWQLFWARFAEDRLALGALVFIVLLVAMAIFAPVVVDIAGAPGPDDRDTGAVDEFGLPLGPSAEHWFGVDNLGRDVFSRVVYGARVSLEVAFVATFLATVMGVLAGLLAGYFRGWTDTLISRFVDVLLAIPFLLLAIGLAAACTMSAVKGVRGEGCLGGLIKPGTGVVIAVISLTSWTYVARIVRGQVLSLREKEFIEAARSVGASHTRIIFRELLPNLTAPIVVYASILIPQVIVYEAALSFLGIGVTGKPTWGQMIATAQNYFTDAWWFMFFPGLALLLTALAFNFVGDALNDALNPRAGRSGRARRTGRE